MKLPIVLMLIAHPVSGKACLGQQVSNAGTDNPFESDLTGHWTCTEHQRYARSLTTVRWWTEQTTFQNCQQHRPVGSASSFHPNNFICKRWRTVQRANKSHKTARDTIKTKRKIDECWFRPEGCLKIACVSWGMVTIEEDSSSPHTYLVSYNNHRFSFALTVYWGISDQNASFSQTVTLQ